MTATLDQAAADPQQTIAELQRQLDERTAALDEALSRELATAEVLQVINSSPGDLAPVFDAMLEKATRLCQAAFGSMFTYDGEHFHTVALHDAPAPYAEFLKHDPPQPRPQSALGRIRIGERVVHIEDYAQSYDATDRRQRALVELGGARSYVTVGLFKDNELLGTLTAYRQEVRPFSDKQIALLQNFADQAVIAMENARLITETREALDQQTATAEVLGVINSSPGDLAPVFDAMLEKATRLCEASFGNLYTYEGGLFRTVAVHGDQSLVEWLKQIGPFQPTPGQPIARLLDGEPVLHVTDATEEEAYRSDPRFREFVDKGAIRSSLIVALRKDGVTLGVITAYRREVRPFSDKQIALLQNFAAQAVIAMENARLITETREALDQQTATAEVLQVINSSPGDLGPVFDAMLEKAMRLCEASDATFYTLDAGRARPVAIRGASRVGEWARQLGDIDPPPGSSIDRLLRGERFVHLLDARDTDAYRDGPLYREMIDVSGTRTAISVGLWKDGMLLGVISVYRQEVRSFSDKQIALLQNFAAQAVIAMENARLITETREALEQRPRRQRSSASPPGLRPICSQPSMRSLPMPRIYRALRRAAFSGSMVL